MTTGRKSANHIVEHADTDQSTRHILPIPLQQGGEMGEVVQFMHQLEGETDLVLVLLMGS